LTSYLRAIVAIFIYSTAAAPLAEAATSPCTFQKSKTGFQGSCSALFDGAPVLTLARVDKITSGAWRTDIRPREIWAGAITGEFAKHPHEKDPLELEIYAGRRGILRTQDGWFRVTQFADNPAPVFDLDSGREIAPGPLDAHGFGPPGEY